MQTRLAQCSARRGALHDAAQPLGVVTPASDAPPGF